MNREEIAQCIHNTDIDISEVPIKGVQHIVNMVFDTLDDKYGQCQYCKNFKHHMTLFSLCKIRHHLIPDCRYYDIDIRYFINKNEFELYEKIHLQRKDNCDAKDLCMRKKTRIKILYKSVELYRLMKNIEKYNIGDKNV